MKFCDFVKEEAIKPELESQDKEGVIQELVASLVASGMLDADNQESIVEAIMKREELGSTG
ncbi:MAG: PTS sugar transporter subunit IIA, partial [Planctomycetota bacterium]|nr:PTS sugar transporter subunit IIA [Planctomycetota bacterium]